MSYLTYNITHKLTDQFIPDPDQEEIYNVGHYFGMSYEQVRDSGAPRAVADPWAIACRNSSRLAGSSISASFCDR